MGHGQGRRQLLATGSADSTARIWDPDTGQTLTTLTGHTRQVVSVAWASDPDGRLLLATGCTDNTARIWDPDTGQTLTTLTGHDGTVVSVAWAVDASGRLLLATGGGDYTARIWDPDTGQTLTTLTGHTSTIWSLAWAVTGDGRLRLATGSVDNTARIWDPDTGQTLTTLTGHTGWIQSVAWGTTRDDRLLLATGSRDDTARIWDPATGESLATLVHPAEVNAVAFFRGHDGEGDLLATGCQNKQAHIYPVQSRPSPRLAGAGTARSRPLAATGRRLDPVTERWKLVTGSLAPIRPSEIRVPADPEIDLTGHDDVVLSVAWTTDASGRRRLATGSHDNTARIWDPGTGDPDHPHRPHRCRPVGSVGRGQGRAAAAGHRQRRHHGPDLGPRHRPDPDHPHRPHEPGRVGGLGHRRGRAAAAGHRLPDDTARIWDPDTGQTLTTLTGHDGTVVSVAWATDRNGRPLLATGRSDQTARIWDPDTGQTLATLTGHTHAIWSVAWAADADGRLLLATGSVDATARVWDPATGQTLTTLTGHTNWVTSVAWATTGDGRLLLATSGDDDTARIWDPATGESLVTLPHRDDVGTIEFIRGDNGAGNLLLATACNDKRARVYQVETPGPPAGDLGTEDDTQADRDGYVTRPGVLAIAAAGLLAVGERGLHPPLGLLADLIAVTAAAPGPELPDQLNNPALATLSVQPAVAGLRGLGWPGSGSRRAGRAAGGRAAHPPSCAPPPGTAREALEASLHAALDHRPRAAPAPAGDPAEVTRQAGALPANTVALLDILGPDAVAADPTLPLRLLHAAAQLPHLTGGQLTFLAAHQPTRASSRPAAGPGPRQWLPRRRRPGPDPPRPPAPPHPHPPGAARPVFTAHLAATTLLYRHHVQPPPASTSPSPWSWTPPRRPTARSRPPCG